MQEQLDNLKDYINTRIKLGKLTLIERGVVFLSNLITDGLVIIFIILAFLFGSLALGFYLSELIGNTYGGFFIISLFYLLLAIIIFVLKDKYLEKPIVNIMLKKILKGEEEEEE